MNTVYDTNELKDFLSNNASVEIKDQESVMITLGTNDTMGSMRRKETRRNKSTQKTDRNSLQTKYIWPQVTITQISTMTQLDNNLHVTVLNTKVELYNEPGL